VSFANYKEICRYSIYNLRLEVVKEVQMQ